MADIKQISDQRWTTDSNLASELPPPTGVSLNPLTTAGDMIIGGAGGAQVRLAAGTSGQVLNIDSVSGLPAWVADSDAGFATPNISLGTAAAAGVAATVIRSDSTIVAFDATAPTTSAVGDAAAVGAAVVAARRDHVHGREAFATPAIVLGTAAAAGAATTHIRSDATIVAFDATTPATVGAGTAAATGSATVSSRRDHVHAVSMASNSGNLASDTTLSTTVYTTVLTTGSLAIGTWLLAASVTVANGNATIGTVEITTAVGTATATFAGQQSGQGELPALSGGCSQATVNCMVTVTVAGTIIVQVKAPGTSASTAKAATPTTSSVKASGWTAVQIA